MQQIQPATEDDMIAAFLEAEFHTARHGSQYQAALKHHFHHDTLPEGFLARKQYASLRSDILAYVRGWPDRLLFTDFPKSDWQKAIMEHADIQLLDYISYSYWDEISGGTHRVVDGAATVATGKMIFEQPNTSFWEMEHMIKKGKKFPPLIIVKNGKTNRYTLLEGHTRATAFALADIVPRDQPVFIATPVEEDKWTKEEKK